MRSIILTLVLSLSMVPIIHSQTIKGNLAIKNVATGKLLRPEGANKADMTSIVLYTPTNWKCLTWQFLPMGEETYQLRNLFTLKTFQGAEAAEGNIPLKQMPLQMNDPSQSWTFEKVDDGIYRIRLKNSQLYITPAESSGRINTPLILTSKTDTDLQLWSVYEQDPTH